MWKRFKSDVRKFFAVTEWDWITWTVMGIAAVILVGMVVSTLRG